jgi:hypothetical protein
MALVALEQMQLLRLSGRLIRSEEPARADRTRAVGAPREQHSLLPFAFLSDRIFRHLALGWGPNQAFQQKAQAAVLKPAACFLLTRPS